jgi:hypothetical protein
MVCGFHIRARFVGNGLCPKCHEDEAVKLETILPHLDELMDGIRKRMVTAEEAEGILASLCLVVAEVQAAK